MLYSWRCGEESQRQRLPFTLIKVFNIPADWQHFLQANGLKASMSRRGNCHDNAVAESFFQLLKRERIKRHVFTTREQARSEIFDYIEMFYNTKRRHGYNNQGAVPDN